VFKASRACSPPRVQLSYDVEIGDAIESKQELPFVMGVMGDFTGQQDPNKPLPLKERKFVNVDLDNFDEVLDGMAPKASYRVKNKLSERGRRVRRQPAVQVAR
jgi:type VI secretion system protein ImpB